MVSVVEEVVEDSEEVGEVDEVDSRATDLLIPSRVSLKSQQQRYVGY